MKNYFSTNLKFLRINKNLTQTQLAESLHKDYSTIGKWENALRSPALEEVIAISEIFEIPVGDLLLIDLRQQKPPISNNNFDQNIQKIAIDNKIEIRYRKNGTLTPDTAAKAIKVIMDVLDEQGKK